MAIRIITCDDEPLALDRLNSMFASFAGVEVVAACLDGRSATEEVARLAPDALFLDIDMPQMDGFDVVEALPASGTPPLIVFVTAYSQFAAQAFDTGALDFLRKPVRRSRLETTLARIANALAQREAQSRFAELKQTIDDIRRAHFAKTEDPPSVWINRRGELLRVQLDRVEMVRAESEYVRLFVDGTSYLHRELIGAFVNRLDPDRFVRIHRSIIIRADRVAAFKRSLHGGAMLRLVDGTDLPIGRKYNKAVRQRLMRGDDRTEA